MLFKSLILLSLSLYSTSAPLGEKRDSTTCSFPQNKGLVAVTKNSDNGGWAMSPDQKCTAGSYCPYACPPGKLMAQWDKSSKTYSYPNSMNGGLYCNKNGEASKPNSDSDYCVDGEDTVSVKNQIDSQNVAFCQTVLPGNEAMLIPTNVDGGSSQSLAVPGPDYWAKTSAHYYINPPGVSTDDACQWGTQSKDQGNWAPYVAGANTDDSGNTFVKIAWNPKYIEQFSDKPSFGIRIECDDESNCNGLDCEIDPSKTGHNGIKGSDSGKSEGASYCVVTATNKSKANIVVFST